MQTLDHERLDVYHLALDFLVFANGVIEGLPRGRSHKRRFYLTARGSATESAALLDACLRLKLLDEAPHGAGKEMVVRIVSMLIRLAQACEQ